MHSHYISVKGEEEVDKRDNSVDNFCFSGDYPQINVGY